MKKSYKLAFAFALVITLSASVLFLGKKAILKDKWKVNYLLYGKKR